MSMPSNRRPLVIDFSDDPGLTHQEFKDECDVNFIIARYHSTGMLSHVASGVPRFLDVSEVGSYREALEQLRLADEYFSKLPAEVRASFNNDPAEYVEALYDDEGRNRLLAAHEAIFGPSKGASRSSEPAPEPTSDGEPADG